MYGCNLENANGFKTIGDLAIAIRENTGQSRK